MGRYQYPVGGDANVVILASYEIVGFGKLPAICPIKTLVFLRKR
jgi:hypothetical protein